MSEKYAPVEGDRVRVVYEGEATGSDTTGFTIEREVPVFFADPGLVSIEKIEPTVETFKPGDVVRGKYSEIVFALGEESDGRGIAYTVLRSPGRDDETGKRGFTTRNFTADLYERVDLG